MTDKKESSACTLEWHVPEGQATPFATHIVVQIIEKEFKISFFEAKPPIRLDNPKPLLNKVRADLVASVIVTVDRLPRFIKVLQSQLDSL